MVYAKQVSKAKTVRYTKIESFRFTFSNKSICKKFLTRENNLKNLTKKRIVKTLKLSKIVPIY